MSIYLMVHSEPSSRWHFIAQVVTLIQPDLTSKRNILFKYPAQRTVLAQRSAACRTWNNGKEVPRFLDSKYTMDYGRPNPDSKCNGPISGHGCLLDEPASQWEACIYKHMFASHGPISMCVLSIGMKKKRAEQVLQTTLSLIWFVIHLPTCNINRKEKKTCRAGVADNVLIDIVWCTNAHL